MPDPLVVLITAASEEQARQIATALLEQKLAACVNLVPVTSLFTWEGQIQDEREVLLIVKTTAQATRSRLIAVVKALHSYTVPEIIGLPVVIGAEDYLRWIADETTG